MFALRKIILKTGIFIIKHYLYAWGNDIRRKSLIALQTCSDGWDPNAFILPRVLREFRTEICVGIRHIETATRRRARQRANKPSWIREREIEQRFGRSYWSFTRHFGSCHFRFGRHMYSKRSGAEKREPFICLSFCVLMKYFTKTSFEVEIWCELAFLMRCEWSQGAQYSNKSSIILYILIFFTTLRIILKNMVP